MADPDRPARLGIAAGVALLSFVAYATTLADHPYWQDAGLFLAGVKLGGGLAPPGYPLYLLLVQPFVAVLTAFGCPFTLAVNAFSAACAAVTAGLVALLVMHWCTPGFRFFTGDGPAVPAVAPPSARVAGALTGLLAGVSYSLWFQALTAEVYTLNAALTVGTWLALTRLGAEGPLGATITAAQRRGLFAVAIVHGLSCANHPTAVFWLPPLALLMVTQSGLFRREGTARVPFAATLIATGVELLAGLFALRAGHSGWAASAFAAAAAAIGGALACLRGPLVWLAIGAAWLAAALLPYAYLVYGAVAYAPLMYADLFTMEGLLGHVTGAKWTGTSNSFGWHDERWPAFPVQVWQEGFLALGLVPLGVAEAWRRARPLVGVAATFAGMTALVSLLYVQGTEYDFWLLPCHLTILAFAGVGLGAAAARLAPRLPGAGLRAAAVAAAAAVLHLPPLLVNRPLVDRRDDLVAEDFTRHLFRHLPPRAILVASSDQECSLAHYWSVVHPDRADVAVVMAPILEPPYVAYLAARYPDLVVPKPRPPGVAPRSQEEWVIDIAVANMPGRPVFVSKRPQIKIAAPFRWLPAGTHWTLTTDPEAGIDEHHWQVAYRNPGPFDRPQRLHFQTGTRDPGTGRLTAVRRCRYTDEIRKFHLQAWINLGDYWFEQRDFGRASEAYRRTVEDGGELTPVPIVARLGESLFAQARDGEAKVWLERVPPESALGPLAALYLGQLAWRDGRRADALALYARVRRGAPDLWATHEPALRQGGMLPER